MSDDADPTRIVADADVLAADMLVGGVAREVLDHVRQHSWMELVASDPLLDDAVAVITALADDEVAGDWRERITDERIAVEHPDGDHPALASAYQGNAAHMVTFDEELTSAGANRSMQAHMSASIRTPAAFAALFDAESLYKSMHDGDYPGPDSDPRA